LSQDEVTALLDAADGTQQRIALALGARCGLRSHEVLDVAPDHVVDTDAGTMLRVHHGKGDEYRETPVPRDLVTTIRTYLGAYSLDAQQRGIQKVDWL
jgi:integrase